MARDEWIGLAKDVGNAWVDDKVPRLSAALAFYAILSAAPFLVVVLAVAGVVFGHDAAQGRIVEQLRELVGDEGAKAIQAMIASADTPGSGWAMVVGVVMLLFGASGVFAELQDSLNTIWRVAPKPGRGIMGVVRDRFLSLAMVFGVGFLLLVNLIAGAALSAMTRFAGLEGVGAVGQTINFVLSLVVFAALFAAMFKYLPDAQIAWRDAWVGAALTSVLFALGKWAIGLYIGRAGLGSAYGAAGSLVVFVVWVYYSGQVFFTGAEMTRAYAERFGGRVRPTENAVAVKMVPVPAEPHSTSTAAR